MRPWFPKGKTGEEDPQLHRGKQLTRYTGNCLNVTLSERYDDGQGCFEMMRGSILGIE